MIFSSIDENEYSNLKEILDEIFGENNFITTFVWEKKKKPSFLNGNVGQKYEYIICYSKDRNVTQAFSVERTTEGKKYPFNNTGNGLKKITFPKRSVYFPKFNDEVIKAQDMSSETVKTKLLDNVVIRKHYNDCEFSLLGEWRYSQKKIDELILSHEKIIISDIPFRPNLIKHGGEIKKMHNLLTFDQYDVGTNEDATKELIKLLDANLFDFNKPSSLIKTLVKSYTYNKKNSTVLDFFAGSSTTADAVMQLNAEDGGNRKFIMVQLPEKTYETNDDGSPKLDKYGDYIPTKGGKSAYEAGYKSIDQISRERIRRAAEKIREDNLFQNPDLLFIQNLIPIHCGETERAFKQFQFALKNIINGVESYSRQYGYYQDTFKKSLCVLSDESRSKIEERLAVIEHTFFPVIESNLYRNYKANDEVLIKKIPFILTYPLQLLFKIVNIKMGLMRLYLLMWRLQLY